MKSLGSGTRHARYTVAKSAQYFRWYVDHFQSMLGEEAFCGDVCELGPGDSLGGGVLYRARGATSVTFFERFQSQPNYTRERKVAAALLKMEREGSAPQSKSVKESNFSSQSIDELLASFRLIEGVAAEDHLRTDPFRYDLILSNSVIQHVSDPLPLLQLCYERLKPGGRMLHVIDLRNMGMLAKRGELAWLEPSPEDHRRMVHNTGRPNRMRYDEYVNWARESGGEYWVKIRHLAGNGEALGDVPFDDVPDEVWEQSKSLVEEAQHRFTPALKSTSASDHAVAAFLLCVTKPAD
ncbi:MAG: class I SAM-dependent methyltransferase [Puniceicoccales bacterium]